MLDKFFFFVVTFYFGPEAFAILRENYHRGFGYGDGWKSSRRLDSQCSC